MPSTIHDDETDVQAAHTMRLRYERATFGGISVLVTSDLADDLRRRQAAYRAEATPDFTTTYREEAPR